MNHQAVTRAFHKRLRRHVGGRRREYFAITLPGVETWSLKELIAAGIGQEPKMVSGGVAFHGRFVDCQRANLHLRTATRILMRVDSFAATNDRQLTQIAADIPWELYLPANGGLAIKVRSRRSRLYHSDVIADSIRQGIGRRLASDAAGEVRDPFGRPLQTLFVRAVADRFTLSLDSSGAALYKRGLKTAPFRAPIRETLAAAILMAAGYDPGLPLVDPMCGSGTFSLEAAMVAKRMAAGRARTFAFMDWPAFKKAQWDYLMREARNRQRILPQPRIHAADIDPTACDRLAAVAADNELSDAIEVACRDFFRSRPADYGADSGLITINPPYGIRIGTARQADAMLGDIGRHLSAHFKGWRVALIAPTMRSVRHFPFPGRKIPFSHGGLKLQLIVAPVP